VDTRWKIDFEVRRVADQEILTWFSYHFGQHGNYTIFLTPGNLSGEAAPSINFEIKVIEAADAVYLPLGIGFAILAALIILRLCFGFSYTYYVSKKQAFKFESNEETAVNLLLDSKEGKHPQGKERLRSLDAFRGFCIVIMIFVNYGGGGYWFFQHSLWNGLTVADLVFPWFIFIMGTAMPLSFSALQRRGTRKGTLLYKVLRRSIILFSLGLFLNNGFDLANWRIPGVLQRFGIAYFVVSLLIIFIPKTGGGNNGRVPDSVPNSSPFRDFLPYWPQWIIIGIFILIHTCLTFLLEVPGCGKGYIGPGGLGDEGKYENCTGGAARYIDLNIFGFSHIYHSPTCQVLYNCAPYDPEGALGNLTSITLCFLGVQLGRIFLHYTSHPARLKRMLIWAIILGGIAAILCFGKQNGGPIPINKNLWSLSFILALGGMANIALFMAYVIIDIKGWWEGTPFIYVGMNPILIYMGHELFSDRFPFSFLAQQHHGPMLASNMIGVTCWVLLAYYMYLQKFFINI